MKFPFGKIFVFGFIVFCFLHCNNQSVDPLPEEIYWLLDRDHFVDSTYDQKFQEQIELADHPDRRNDMATIYFAKGDALDYYLEYDSIYMEDCKRFYQKYKNEIRDSFQVQLPYFVGSQIDFGGDIDQSGLWLKKAIQNSNNPTTDTYVGYAYLILSQHKKIQSQLDSAQHFAYKAFDVFERTKDTINMGGIQYSLFRINSSLNEHEAAKESLNKMIHYAKLTTDTVNLAMAYIGHVLRIKSEKENNFFYSYTDSISALVNKWSQPSQYFKFMSAMLQAQANIRQKKYTAAKKFIDISDALVKENDPITNYYLEELHIKYDFHTTGQLDRKRYQKWLKTSIEEKDFHRTVNQLSIGIEDRLKRNDYKGAYSYLNQKIKFRDSLWSNELKSKLVEFEKKYETAKKEQKIAEQKQALLKRNTTIGSLLGALLILILLSTLYYIRRKRNTAERERQLQENFSRDLLKNTEDERSRIAGDLHDSVNHNLLTLKQKSISGQNVSEKELEDIIQQVRSISYNLYPSMFEEVGLEKSIEELCRKVMSVSSIQIVTQIAYHKTLKTSQELQIYRIVEEALNNIIKHSEATHAIVIIKSLSDQLEVSVKDNGKGMGDDILSGDKITFGMTNMIQRAKAIKGKINVSSSKKGTELKLIVNS